MKLAPADIIITTDRKSWFSKTILAVLNFFQKDLVRYQHAILVINDEECIEALWKIKRNNIRDRLKDFKRYKIIRCKYIKEPTRRNIVKTACKLEGLHYGAGRIFLQLLDQVFHTNFFTGLLKAKKHQICSTVVSWAYYTRAGIKFNNVDWKSCEPDDIDDESSENPEIWATILEWEID